jgi:hypothetical protein
MFQYFNLFGLRHVLDLNMKCASNLGSQDPFPISKTVEESECAPNVLEEKGCQTVEDTVYPVASSQQNDLLEEIQQKLVLFAKLESEKHLSLQQLQRVSSTSTKSLQNTIHSLRDQIQLQNATIQELKSEVGYKNRLLKRVSEKLKRSSPVEPGKHLIFQAPDADGEGKLLQIRDSKLGNQNLQMNRAQGTLLQARKTASPPVDILDAKAMVPRPTSMQHPLTRPLSASILKPSTSLGSLRETVLGIFAEAELEGTSALNKTVVLPPIADLSLARH